MARHKMPLGALKRGRELAAATLDYMYVAGGTPFTLGYCKSGVKPEEVVTATTLYPADAPVALVVSHDDSPPSGHHWLRAIQPQGASVHYAWKTPFGGTEHLLTQGIPDSDLLPEDRNRQRRREQIFLVMAAAQMPESRVRPVFNEVGGRATDAIMFATWLFSQPAFGADPAKVRAWLKDAHPSNSGRHTASIRLTLAGGPYAATAWNEINTLIRGAARFFSG